MVIFNIEFQQNSIENYRCFYKLKLDQNSSNEQQTDDVSLIKRIIGPVGHYQVTFDMVLLVLSLIFIVLCTIHNNNNPKILQKLMDFECFYGLLLDETLSNERQMDDILTIERIIGAVRHYQCKCTYINIIKAQNCQNINILFTFYYQIILKKFLNISVYSLNRFIKGLKTNNNAYDETGRIILFLKDIYTIWCYGIGGYNALKIIHFVNIDKELFFGATGEI